MDGVGLEEGVGTDGKVEGFFFDMEGFVDEVGAPKVHLVKLGGFSFGDPVDPKEEAGVFMGKGFLDGLFKGVEGGFMDAVVMVAGDGEDDHFLPGALPFTEGESAEGAGVGIGVVGFEICPFPPGADCFENVDKPRVCEVTLFKVKDTSFRAGDDEAEVALSFFILGEGELHFVAVVPGLVARDDGKGLLLEEGSDVGLLGGELGGVAFLLPGTAAAAADVLTEGRNPISRRV